MSVILNEVDVKKHRGAVKDKAKSGDYYAPDNRQFGKNRWDRRLHQITSNSTDEYNKVDMSKFFKDDLLDFNVPIVGETDDYLVRLCLGGVLRNIQDVVRDSGIYKLNHKIVKNAIIKSLNNEELTFSCTCPDWKYTHAYYATQNDTNAGEIETRPSIQTNPDDTKGGMCKHIARVVSSQLPWLMKITSVIVNYTKWMEKYHPNEYQRDMFPKIYGKDYEDMQMTWDDLSGEEKLLPSDKDTIDASNKWAKSKNQFKKDNEYRFKKSDDIEGQKSFDFDGFDVEDTSNEISD